MSVPESNLREYAYSERDFERVRKLIYARVGIVLAESKQDMVYSRLARRLRALGINRFTDYLDYLEREGGDEWQSFTNALTTNLTSFFREAHHFEILKQHLTRIGNRPKVALWCSAASTGEEPYSLAMTVVEHYGSFNPPVTILATDVDTNVLEVGHRGVYPMERIEQMSQERLKKFFLKGTGPNEGMCKVSDKLRDLITFRQLNLLDPSWPMREVYEAIFCRNVMIYFDEPTKERLLDRLADQLVVGGHLYIGHSERFIGRAADKFTSIGQTIYRKDRA
jgi:chemotaxis protein methyltransferase CheR